MSSRPDSEPALRRKYGHLGTEQGSFPAKDHQTMRRAVELAALTLALALLCPGQAHAYIDPGAGSALVQSVLAILVAGAFLVKQFAARISSAVARLFSRNEPQ
jgi:hypothetical protein